MSSKIVISFDVQIEMVSTAKFLMAFFADEWFFTSMNSSMSFQFISSSKLFNTAF